MKLRLILITGLFFFSITSCKKSFLNGPTPQNGDLTSNIIFTTTAGANEAMTGIYWILRSENYNGYAGDPNNSGDLTCRGLRSTMEWFEVRGDDVYDTNTSGDSWWGAIDSWTENSYGRILTGSRTRQIWDMFYKVINNANAVIQNVPSLTDASAAQKAALIAEAKSLRGYSYFWLARAYQFTYAANINAPGVPIYTTTASQSSTGNPRAPLKDVYSLIVSDLEGSIPDLPATNVAKYRINKNVAEGMLAEVYQEMAMADPTLWAKASSNAAAAMTGYSLMNSTQYAGGFNDYTVGEVIWGFPVPNTVADNLSFYSIYSFMDPYYGYYHNLGVNTTLYNMFTTTDYRRARFANVYGANAAYPYRLWFSTKYTSATKTTADVGDIIIMRASEMILIQAEALAQQGNVQASIDMLFTLQSARDVAAVKLSSATSQPALITAILLERRKELYGEIGAGFFDLKRYQLPLVRDGNHKYPITIPANDPRWLVQIPQVEILANPKIGPQNP